MTHSYIFAVIGHVRSRSSVNSCIFAFKFSQLLCLAKERHRDFSPPYFTLLKHADQTVNNRQCSRALSSYFQLLHLTFIFALIATFQCFPTLTPCLPYCCDGNLFFWSYSLSFVVILTSSAPFSSQCCSNLSSSHCLPH